MRLPSPLAAIRFLAAFLFFTLSLLAPSWSAAAPGALEQVTLTTIPGGENKALVATLQSDGKVLTAGYAYFGTKQFSLTRYNANGSVDTAFGTNGTRLEWLGPGNAEAHGVAQMPDGKIIVGGFAVSDLSRFGIARFNADGSLDTSYGGGGAVTPIGTGSAAYAMAVQSDGKILLGGWSLVGGTKAFTIARYVANSPTLDTSFGSGGVVVAAAGANDQQINALAIQSDGRIVAAGSDGASAVVVRRYNADGTLDTTFGSGGTFSTSSMKGGRALEILASGSILVAGDVPSVNAFEVMRLSAAGALDTTFGVSGFGQQGAGAGATAANDLKVQADGKIVVAGTGYSGGSAIAVARFNADGSNDTGFGSSGVTIHRYTLDKDEGNAVVIPGSGQIVVAGAGNNPADCACNGGAANEMLAAFTSTGALDTSFSGGGMVEVDAGSKQAAGLASALQSDGKLVVAGWDRPTPSVPSVMEGFLTRYNADGSLDTTFNGTGMTPTAGDKLKAIAIQADGKAVAAGYATGNFNGSPATRITVVRRNIDGTNDSTFGSFGAVNITLDGPTEEANAIAVQADGKIVVGGVGQLSGGFTDALFARLNSDGTLDTSFGGTGKVRVAMSTGNDRVNAIVIQGDGKIVGAGTGEISGSQSSIMVTRLNTDGSIDTTFGTGGIVTTTIGTGTAIASAMGLQGDGKIVVGGQWFNGVTDDFALVRYNANGTVDGGFGSAGVVTTDMGNHNRIFGLTILPNGKIAVAGEWAGAYALGLYLPSGALDTTFGTNGTVYQPANAGADVAYSIVRRADGKLWVTGDASAMIGVLLFTGDGGATPKATPTVSLASSVNPSTSGQSVTFTATVSGSAGTATGTVAFNDGATAISGCASVALSGGTAACTTSALASGTHSISASYSGDVNYNAATSNTVTQTVNAAAKANPSIGLASSTNPSTVGQSVIFTATVSGSAGTPTGTVNFLDGASSISGCAAVALSSGSATCNTSALSAGSHTIVASYSGDGAYNAGSSGGLNQTVQTSGGTTGTNVALSSNGGVASASSTNASFSAMAINNGELTGANVTANAWVDDTRDIFPDWVQIDFSSTQTIDHVVVYSVQDNYTSPTTPTDTMTFTTYGVTDFDVQGWNGSAWVTLGSVTGNNLVKRTVSFTAVAVSKVRVVVNNALLHYSRIVEVEAWTSGSTPPPATGNVALAANGGVASASSTNASFNLAAVNNGEVTGANVTANAWVDDTRDAFPDWVQIDFSGSQTIDHVVVYSVQDNYTSPTTPTDTMTFTTYGVTDFDVQGWNGSAWVTLGSVTGNNLVKRTVSFTAVAVSKVRVVVNNALLHYSRIVEVEAWTSGSTPPPPPPAGTNFALASNGAVASASSTNASFTLAAVNNGEVTGADITANAWVDDTRDAFPDWVQLDLNGGHAIDHVVVYSVQDSYASPTTPTDTMTFTTYGVTDFDVQGWNGSAWVTLGSVTGNNLVKRTVSFTAFTTSKVRVVVNNALLHYSRIVEVEAWGS